MLRRLSTCCYSSWYFLCANFSLCKFSELKWSRTINTLGNADHNVSYNFHMEHTIRHLKRYIRRAGWSIYPMAIQRIIAKSLGPIRHTCSQFEKFLNDGNEWLVVFGFGQQKLLSKTKATSYFHHLRKTYIQLCKFWLKRTYCVTTITETILLTANNEYQHCQ